MIPSFGDLFGEEIPAYFAMLMTGFAVAIGLAVVWARRSQFDHDVMIDLGLGCLITGVIGARVLHVFVDGYFWNYVNLCVDPHEAVWQITQAQCVRIEGEWDAVNQICHSTQADCFQWAKFWNGGLVWYGGLLGAGVYGIHFLYKERFPVLKGMDLTGMVIPLGVFFGRLGCWFGGCCFGVQSEHWSAVSFPEWSPASEAQFREGQLPRPDMPSLEVLPMQLWEAAACLAISAFCTLVLHPRKRFDGQVFAVSMALYAIARIALEAFRADDRGIFGGLSTSQWIGVAIVAVCVGFYVRWKRRAERHLALPFAEPFQLVPEGAPASAPSSDDEE